MIRIIIAIIGLGLMLISCNKEEETNPVSFQQSAYKIAPGDSTWIAIQLEKPATGNIPVKLQFTAGGLVKNQNFTFIPEDIDVLNEVFLAFSKDEKSTGFYFVRNENDTTSGVIQFKILSPPAPLILSPEKNQTEISFSF